MARRLRPASSKRSRPSGDTSSTSEAPAIAGEREECYAITEEGAGSDVDAIEATADRDGDHYRLNGVKWHVTSFNSADFAFFQARLRGGPHHGEHAMFLVDLPSPGVRVVRTPAYSHSASSSCARSSGAKS